MASQFQPPPTYAEVVLYDKSAKDSAELLASAKFNPIWLKWFLDLVKGLGSGGAGSGTVTSFSFTTANGISGAVALATTTPTLTLALGNITPGSVAASGDISTTGTHTIVAGGNVSGANLSGTNTGDQTSVSGNAGTATALQNARTIGGVSFNGTANITVNSATGSFAVTVALTAATIRPTTAGGYLANDTSPGVSGTLTTGSLVGKTLTFKDGLITDFS